MWCSEIVRLFCGGDCSVCFAQRENRSYHSRFGIFGAGSSRAVGDFESFANTDIVGLDLYDLAEREQAETTMQYDSDLDDEQQLPIEDDESFQSESEFDSQDEDAWAAAAVVAPGLGTALHRSVTTTAEAAMAAAAAAAEAIEFIDPTM